MPKVSGATSFMTSFSYDVIPDEDPVCRQVSQHHYLLKTLVGPAKMFQVSVLLL